MEVMKGNTVRAIDIDRLGRVESKTGPKYLAHWVLKSAQRDKMVLWYQKVLGMTLVFENKMISFLTYDHEHHRLAIVSLPRPAKLMIGLSRIYRKLYGLDHIAFNFGSLRELLSKYRALKEQGIEPIWCINHGPTTSVYYEDPDGNRLEFQSDNFDRPEDLQAFAEGLDFVKNPIGVNFNPDLLWDKLEAGVPEVELRKRGSATPPGKKPVGGMRAITWRTL
jgi:catechol 2,3-dioxygenase-like lactoylglutathione lyase family enzyme